MRFSRLLAAALAVVLPASPVWATIYTADFEDVPLGGHYDYAAPFHTVSALGGIGSGDASNRFLLLDVFNDGRQDFSYFLLGLGDSFILPDNTATQYEAVLLSFDIFIPTGGALYLNGFHYYDSEGHIPPTGSWQHIVAPTYHRYGSIVGILGTGAAVDNLVFDNFASSRFVPEPATWAMMVLGFGMLGTAIRGRRRQLSFDK